MFNASISQTNLNTKGGNGKYMPFRKKKQNGKQNQEEKSLLAYGNDECTSEVPLEENLFYQMPDDESFAKILWDLIKDILFYFKKIFIL